MEKVIVKLCEGIRGDGGDVCIVLADPYQLNHPQGPAIVARLNASVIGSGTADHKKALKLAGIMANALNRYGGV